MRSLYEYLLNYIDENRAIDFGTAMSNYGECIILGGGPASGKGYIQSFINAEYKTYDVDDLKKLYIKLLDKGKLKDEYKEFDFSKPDDVTDLHKRVKSHGWKKKQADMIFKDRFDQENSSKLLPNLLFDKVCGEIDDITEVAIRAKALGYKITIVWVLSNLETSKINNLIRPRIVDEKNILIPNHRKAYKTLTRLFNNKEKQVNDYIDNAWLAYSAGFGRKLEGKYAASPFVKIKKDKDNNFIFDTKSMVDDFLKRQYPIDYKELQKNLKKDPSQKIYIQTLKFIEQENLDMNYIKNYKGES